MAQPLTDPETDYRRRVAAAAEEAWSETDAPSARHTIECLGQRGLIAERWSRPDDLFGMALIDELFTPARYGLSVAVSLHVEAVIGMMRRFAPTELADLYLAGAVAGSLIGCVAASEEHTGSDLSGVQTTVSKTVGGWHVQGDKKFVTLSPQADFVIALGRLAEGPPRLCAVLVPRSGYSIVKTHRMHGADDLDTSWITLDATVPAHHMLGPPGAGIAVFTHGLVHERLSITAQVLAACRLALSLAVTRAAVRSQFGVPIWNHQALRLRIADLYSEYRALAAHLRQLATLSSPPTREIAGLKVTAARFGERCLSECMHVFGADGYVQDAAPLGGLWRAIRMGRIGGGTDEMMSEIVAKGLTPDHELYERFVAAPTVPQAPG